MGVNTNPTFSPPLGSHNQYTNSQVLLQKQTPFSWCQGPHIEQTIDLPIQPHHAECIALDGDNVINACVAYFITVQSSEDLWNYEFSLKCFRYADQFTFPFILIC